MRDYDITFQGIPQGKVADIPTATLHEMIAYMDRGGPMGGFEKEKTTRQLLRDRIVLELEIREMGL